MYNVMTENMLEEARKNFENTLKTDFDFLQQHTKDDLLIKHVESIRNTFIVHAVAPHSFPAGLIHEDDYYGSDEQDKKVSPKGFDLFDLKGQSGTDGNC